MIDEVGYVTANTSPLASGRINVRVVGYKKISPISIRMGWRMNKYVNKKKGRKVAHHPKKLFAGLMCMEMVALSTGVAYAQPHDQAQATRVPRALALEEVVVMARRTEEVVGDVPLTIQAIPGQILEEMNLFNLEDLSKVTAGISLSRAGGGITTIRGVSFNPTAQTNPTTSFYINESPVQPSLAMQSVFDIGQYEILRGPQGTLRGQSAPTGAITIRTRQANLSQFGGAITTAITDSDGRTVQGAVNLPIIQDVLGVRIAGMTDHTESGISSVNNNADPYAESDVGRISVLYQPSDELEANVMYQKLKTDTLGYGGAVFGAGSPGGTIKNSAYALPITLKPGYNGPVLGKRDQKTIREFGDRSRATQEIATAQVNYDLLGQSLTYVGGWSRSESTPATNFADVGNLVTGDWPGRSLGSDLTRWTHEVRLSSFEPLIGGLVDYTVGFFFMDEETKNDVNNGISFQNGAFGSLLGAPLPYSPNLDFSTVSMANSESDLQEKSIFGTLTFHLTDTIELATGARFITAEKDALRVNSQTAGWRAVAGACPAGSGGILGRTYAGICDVPVASRVTGTVPDKWDKEANVFSASLSHRLSDKHMTYLTYGESWRPGPTQGNLINGTNDPTLTSLQSLEDEDSKSIELGLKSSWLDRRLSTNLAYYKQEYSNYVNSVLTGIPYLADTGVGTRSVTLAIPMNSNIDVDVQGVEMDFNFAATDRWTIGGAAAWADATYDDQTAPCWDGNFDGIPDTNSAVLGTGGPALFDQAGVKVAQCSSSGLASLVPKWNANLHTTYNYPIADHLVGFVTANANHTPKNPYKNETYTTPSYTIIDLNLGLRDEAAGWEVQLFVRNLTDNDTVTTISQTDVVSSTSSAPGSLFGFSGYKSVEMQRPRELGLSFRYAFGSK